MSAQFNDTSTYKGLVQIYEKEIGAARGYVSDNSDRLKEFAADVNLAWDDYLTIALRASGKWQFDDSNLTTDYPIIYANLVSGQRDYTFTSDGTGNLILDIYNVAVLPSATATTYQEINTNIDQQTAFDASDISEEQTNTGVPWQYDKTANGIFLDPAPGYNATSGLKIWINREPSYFVSTDTTKMPGCPGNHHRYFALKPALDYARRQGLKNYNLLREEVVSFEGDAEKGIVGSIERDFTRREKDVTHVFRPAVENNITQSGISF